MPSIDQIERDHTPEAIASRLSKGPQESYLRDWVYGGIDGAVTSFAVVSGVMGANLSVKTILILGAANLIADGFSMAASNYLGTKSELEEIKRLEAVEREEIRRNPEGEKEEVRQLLAKKGLRGETLDQAVTDVTSRQETWVEIMLTEEHGLPLAVRAPKKAAMNTFIAFVICGSVPLVPFLFASSNSFQLAAILTGLVFFAIGSLKSKWSIIPWWKSGMTTMLIGMVASILAYAVGALLR
ncbi:MAG: VIT1/CCC1 transporter family protein [Bdellovibrionota bacterium]